MPETIHLARKEPRDTGYGDAAEGARVVGDARRASATVLLLLDRLVITPFEMMYVFHLCVDNGGRDRTEGRGKGRRRADR